MAPLLLVVGGGFLIFMMFMIIGIVLSRGDQVIDKRLQTYAGQRATAKEAGDDESQEKKSSFIVQTVDKAVARRGFAASIATDLSRADLKFTVGEFILLTFASCLLVSLLVFLITGSVAMAPLGLVAGYFVPRVIVKVRKGRRLHAFNDQLGDTITLMANALRAGYSLLQAMEAVSRELPPPVSTEFARVVKEVGLGLSHEEAMKHLQHRIQSDDLDLMITAINVQHEVGGNLSEILDTIGHTIRERVRIQGEIRVLTAQGMMSGYVISFLPIGLMLVLFLINRQYIGSMFKEPCGWAMLAFMAVTMTAGFFSIQKIVHIDV
jgi:tight adherence protein B